MDAPNLSTASTFAVLTFGFCAACSRSSLTISSCPAPAATCRGARRSCSLYMSALAPADISSLRKDFNMVTNQIIQVDGALELKN